MVAKQVDPHQPVLVMAERKVETIVLYLGVLYAGCFYLPVDPETPTQRVQDIVDFYQPKTTLCCDYIKKADKIDEKQLASIRDKMTATDPFCILFTSGSTGNPKGILMQHLGMITMLDTVSRTRGMRNDEIIANQLLICYADSCRDIYMTIFLGATMIIVPNEIVKRPKDLLKLIDVKKVTTIDWASTLLEGCVTEGAIAETQPKHLRQVVSLGSIASWHSLHEWARLCPKAQVIIDYGLSEIFPVSYYYIDKKRNESGTPLIGKPLEHVRMFLLDQNKKPVRDGEVGELYIISPALAAGYFKNPTRTAESFIQNPLQSDHHEIAYRTKDLASRRPDGNFQFHGRCDRHVKYRAFLVELDDIERVAKTCKGVDIASCQFDAGKELLWLFYSGKAELKDLATHLRGQLPPHMLPRKFLHMDKMPMTSTGKVDGKKLEAMMK